MTSHPPPTPRLQVNDTLGRRVVPIDKAVFRIGRRGESDLRALSTDVSREHAEITTTDDGRFVLKDNGSRYGTFVNDEQVSERVLRHRDKIRLGRSGNAELVFLLDDGADSHGSTSVIVDFRKVTSLLDGLRAMGPSRVLDEVLALVMDSAIEVTGAERGFIMLANLAGELEFKIGRARGRILLSGHSFDISQKIPQEAFRSGRMQIFSNLMDDQLAAQHMGTIALGIRHVLCAPLSVVQYVESRQAPAEQAPIGVLYLDSRDKEHLLSAATQSAVEVVATEAAAAIESARLYREAAEKRRMEGELQLAAEIQRALLPEPRRAGAYFEVAAASIPCRAIGGDFFDYFDLPGGAFGFLLGDVAGKGPSAALLTAMIQGIYASYVNLGASPAALMASVNEGLIRRSIQSRFATVFCGRLAPDGRLTYSNAGHNPPMVIHREGVRRLETGGMILGLFAHATHEEETVQLAPGDIVVVFSDGVSEARNAAGEEFDEERLLAALASDGSRAPVEVLDRLVAAVRTFTAGAAQHDDITAMVLRYQTPASASA